MFTLYLGRYCYYVRHDRASLRLVQMLELKSICVCVCMVIHAHTVNMHAF